MQALKPIRAHTSDPISRSNFPQFRSYVLSVQDLQRLQEHLQRPDLAWLPLVAHVLRHKIRMAKPFVAVDCDGVVTGASLAAWSIDGGPVQTGLLSHRARCGTTTGVIPVCSTLGAALIGLSVGDRTPYLRADRKIGLLKVLRVTVTA